MTQPLSADSPRRVHARRFGAELERAVRVRRSSLRGLAATTGVSRTAIHFYRDGVNLPTPETAGRLADVLDWPKLRRIISEARSGTCEACSRVFLATGNGNQRYCSEDCRRARNRLRGVVPSRERAVMAERKAGRLEAAIGAYCRACEPEGMCRDAACHLRPVSPLRIARRATA